MNPDVVRKTVEEIRKFWEDTDDDEDSHIAEDRLYKTLLRSIADGECENPAECARIALETANIDFKRWYA